MSSPYGNRLSPNMYWPEPHDRDNDITWTDTPADEAQRGTLHALLASHQRIYTEAAEAFDAHDAQEQGDPQWAGPSLPHPSEATTEAERAELDEGWDDWQHGIEPNQNAAEIEA